MALPSSPILSVRRGQPQLVVPAKATPRELKELSDIDDQDGFRFQIPVIIFYQSHPSMKGKDSAKIITEALAKALVYYYPLAGRLVEGPNRKLIVDCTGELGVLFIEADADVTLEQLGDTIRPPCPYLEELLYEVPGSGGILGCPLLLLQVTRLLCGGFVLALRLNHTMADAAGFVQFLKGVAEMAQGRNSALSVQPVWGREILNARNPPRVTRIHNEYCEVNVSKGTTTTRVDVVEDGHMVQRSLFFSPKDMVAIRKHLPPHLRNCSTFELISACLWRCRTRALELAPDEVVRFSSLVNVNNSKNKFHLPYGYYGNGFCFPASVSKAEALCKNSLQYAVELVKRAKAAATGSNGEEYIRSVADLMVIKGRPMYITSWNFIISDNTRAGFEEVDFGWGKPLYGGPAGASPLLSFLTRFKNGIAVPICLPFPVMERFQRELSRMTQQPVEDPDNTKIVSML